MVFEITPFNEEEKTDSTWLLFALGGLGVLAGGFLVMRMKRKVSAT